MATKKLRTAKQCVQFAIQEAVDIIQISKSLDEIFQAHHKNNIALIKQRTAPTKNLHITLSGHDLNKILGALRDYATLRIANTLDHLPSTKSMKDLNLFNLRAAKQIPEIKEVLEAHDNWIGHINKRFLGPVSKKTIYSKDLLSLLHQFQSFAAWTTEKK